MANLSSAIQYLPYGAKIVKIGLVDPEILQLQANKSGTTQNWLPKQRPFRNWKNWTGSRKLTQIHPIWWEVFAIYFASKIYSPSGKFAERAKLEMRGKA